MEPQQPTTHRTDDDVEGHGRRFYRADAEQDETDDVEGHRRNFRHADAEVDETDDVEGHRRHFFRADAEQDETDDVEGHRRHFFRADAEQDETDDVEGHGITGGLRPTHPRSSDEDVAGHLSGALGSKKHTEDAG